jgi:Tol biopolymer transport system component
MATGTTERVSVSSREIQGNRASLSGNASADGRFVVFDSDADNLVPGDSNGSTDVFLRDRVAGRTSRVSVAASGRQADRGAFFGAISANGRFVVFSSDSANLVPNDRNGVTDVFLLDLRTRQLRRVSVGPRGREANGLSFGRTVSADGRYVVFASVASNLVPRDTNLVQDIFVRDLRKGTTRRASVGTGGTQANADSNGGELSRDSRLVAFASEASNLVPGDRNFTSDVFVHDFARNRTERVSVASDGSEAEPFSFSFGASMSADGRYVAFQSGASNLVPGDDNATTDVFIRDRQRGRTERVVLGPPGSPTSGNVGAALSATGRFVAMSSLFSFDLFVLDRRTGATRQIDRPLTPGAALMGASFAASVSRDGRTVVFQAEQDDLVAGDTNRVLDVFVRHLLPWPAP